MVLALEAYRCHVGTGVGGRLTAPDDPGPPGACRRGRGAASGAGQEDGLMWAARAPDGMRVKLGRKDRDRGGQRDTETQGASG